MTETCCHSKYEAVENKKSDENCSCFHGKANDTETKKDHQETELSDFCDQPNAKSACCSHPEENEALSDENLKKKEYLINGMDCPTCATTIEKGLRKLADIQEATVFYHTAKLAVTGMDADAFSRAEEEVENLGFTVEPLNGNNQDTVYKIEGMDCGSCAKTIENHLHSLPTVYQASVNFSTGKMKVSHTNSADDIVNEVSKAGFTAVPVSEDNKLSKKRKSLKGNGLIILSGLLITAGFIGSLTGVLTGWSTLFYAAAIIISGFKPVKSAFYAVKSRSLDMNVLMSAAAIGAALIGEWFEGATVVWLFALGNALQNRSMEQTRKSISHLMELAPSEAWMKKGAELVKVPVEDIVLDSVVIIKPGERIPLDGEIMEGETTVNQASITGESVPIDKQKKDTVFAGTINESGSIEMKVTKRVEDTSLSNIIHLVEEAQEQKAPAEAFIDKFASIYTPIVFVIAIAVIVVPPLLGAGLWADWAYKGLALLVIACPCALVISTPVAIVSAIGNAAGNGVLIKGGTFLEKAGSVDTIAFDKTGTLTEGQPKVTKVEALTVSEKELLTLAVTLEEYSAHPIAKTIASYAKAENVLPIQGTLFKNIAGKGVQATIDGQVYYAGNVKLFEDLDVNNADLQKKLEAMHNNGESVVIIGTRADIMGVLSVADTVRSSSAGMLQSLQELGVVERVMLTGDHEGTAKAIAEKTAINRYFSGLLPEDKVTAIKQLQQEGQNVAMVGDGINDAPALATADIGIAMGGAGTDAAMETADIVLMADNLEKLPYTVKVSRKALAIIKQNIWFALLVKLAALALIFPGWLTLWMAVLSDTGAAIIVILNALRLLKVRD